MSENEKMYIGKFGHLREVSENEKMYIGKFGHLRERERRTLQRLPGTLPIPI